MATEVLERKTVDREARAALITFVALEVLAVPLLLLHLAKKRWFFLDEWDYLITRQVTDLGDLFRPHNGHWSTLPIVAYRVMWSLFGLRSYVPYQAMIVILHVIAVALIRVVMRRCGVAPWTATVTASLLILFGSGQDDIVWAFQIGLVGSLVLGLVQLILADHDGPWDRRDWLGLMAGAAGLMCSGVALTMLLVVGAGTWLRRGWRMAAYHVIPLVAVYLLWWSGEGRPGGHDPTHSGLVHKAGQIAQWIYTGIAETFLALGSHRVVGIALVVLLVGGLFLASRGGDGEAFRRRTSSALGLLVGAVAFVSLTGWDRWYLGAAEAKSSRYLYVTAAMVLPALAVAADAIIRRWPVALPAVLALLLIGVPGNISRFGSHQFLGPPQTHNKYEVLGAAWSPLVHRVPPSSSVNRLLNPLLTAGWLAQAQADGKLPHPIVLPDYLSSTTPLLLGFRQVQLRPLLLPSHCNAPKKVVYLDPAVGDLLSLRDGKYLVSNRKGPDSHWSLDVIYQVNNGGRGNAFKIQLPDLHLRVRPAKQNGTVTVCT